MTITLRFCETDLTVTGEHHEAVKGTMIDPPEYGEFEIASVKTRCGDDITGIFGSNFKDENGRTLGEVLELACLKALGEHK